MTTEEATAGAQTSGAGPKGINRRDLLIRGGKLGAAAVWTVPVIQIVAMTPAHAESPSSPGHHDPGTGSPPPQHANENVPPPANPSSSGGLAFTGTKLPVGPAAAVGAGALAAGAGLIVAAHRKRASDDAAELDEPAG